MIHAPIFGIRFLARTAIIAAAVAAVPVVLKKCKPLAKQVGEALVKLGEKLQEDAVEREPAGASPKAAAVKQTAAQPSEKKVVKKAVSRRKKAKNPGPKQG